MSTQVETNDITVRSLNGTYLTSKIRGVLTSCTAGPRQAAERLGAKVYGASLVTVEELSSPDHNTTHWRLHAEPISAFGWQSGLIEFGREVPEGAIKFASGFDVQLRTVVGVLAREGQGASTGKLLVPGVPEGESEIDQVHALVDWVKWCAEGNGREGRGGVVFECRKGSQQ